MNYKEKPQSKLRVGINSSGINVDAVAYTGCNKAELAVLQVQSLKLNPLE
jgi:hypothetical protein